MPSLRPDVLDAREQLGRVIRASEDWEASYKANPEVFDKLVRTERRIERDVLVYLKDFAERAPAWVKWNLMPLTAAESPLVDDNERMRATEEALLLAALYGGLEAAMMLGMTAGELTYSIGLGVDRITELSMQAARDYAGKRAKGLTKTSIDLIRQSIATSIEVGESHAAAMQRLQRIVGSPFRADLIARNEVVDAYQIGLRNFAHETGAISKTWKTVRGACPICAPLHDVTKEIDEAFETIKGPVLRPRAHVNCRCGLRYNYPND